MAIIPTYQQDTQQNAPGLAAAENPETSTIRGKSIEQAGAGLFNYGLALEKEQHAKDSLARNQAELAARTAALQHSDDVQNDVVLTTAADGQKAVTDFDSKIKQKKDDYIASIDSKWAPYAGTAYDAATQQSRSEMSAYSRKMFVENAKNVDEGILSDMSLAIQKNPQRFATVKAEWDRYTDSVVESGARSPADGQKMKQLAAKQFSETVISSYENLQDPVGFHLAKASLDGPLGANYTPEERTKRMHEIRTNEMQFTVQDIKSGERARTLSLRATEARQQANFKADLADAVKLSELPEGAARSASISLYRNRTRLRVASGELKEEDGNRLIRSSEDDLKETQDKNVAPYFRQVFDEADLNGLKNKVDKAYDAKSISAGDRIRILKEIDSEQDRRLRRGDTKKSSPEVKATLRYLTDGIPATMIRFQWKDETDLRFKIEMDLYDQISKKSFGGNLKKIGDSLANKYYNKGKIDSTQRFIHGVNIADKGAIANISKMPGKTTEEKRAKIEALKQYNALHSGDDHPVNALPAKKVK